MGHVMLAENGEKRRVGKIVAAGQNYADHTKEMGMPRPSAPVLFLKPSTSLLQEGSPIVFPSVGELLHHEVELGLLIGRDCKDVGVSDALEYVDGYFLALDLTLRDLQGDAKERGLPWSTSKGFDGACPVSKVLSLPDLSALTSLELGLAVNGETRQLGSTADMVWTPDELVSIASTFFTLERGDLLLTGTPAGVGPLKRGDAIEAWLGDDLRIRFEVV